MISKVILGMLLVGAAETQSCDKKIPIWRGKIYVGNYVEGTIERKQDGEVISTKAPKFGNYFCIEKEQFQCMQETYVINCKEFSKQSACGLENH